ncbi:MAG: pyridoxal phosphate-dependent aminotransferase [Gemmataceae bacterium]|jgi:aspartate aminotransferase|nr:pyridoxal phosphate-dependent aminotransferase [Gemmataceae bacterium]
MIPISRLAASVKPSATLAAGAKAKALKSSGVKVYDFALGEPDFDTPLHIQKAAAEAASRGETHYTPVNGIPELKTAICQWYSQYHGFTCKPEQVIVSNGAKQSIHNALAAVCDPGDEVIIPTPYWVSYSDLVSMTGAIPKLVTTTAEASFKITPAQLKEALSPKTKIFMINSPCNPTGITYTREELAALAEVLLPTNVTILSDEIYEQLTYDGVNPTCFATLKPELQDRTITVSGASKSYAMTGWRMGWAVAPKHVVDAMGTIQGQETSCPSSISQHALLAALSGPQDCVAQMREEFRKRRDFVCEKLAEIAGITFPKPNGAFYVFFNVQAFFNRQFGNTFVTDSLSFCNACLEQAHVSLVAGSAFGQEGYARMSYASSIEELAGGIAALKKWLQG